MKWYSTQDLLPGKGFAPSEAYETPDFVVIYHHGDNELMTNIAFWNGTRFIVGGTCYCQKCRCDCNYQCSYSDECEITHWLLIELPGFKMSLYDND